MPIVRDISVEFDRVEILLARIDVIAVHLLVNDFSGEALRYSCARLVGISECAADTTAGVEKAPKSPE